MPKQNYVRTSVLIISIFSLIFSISSQAEKKITRYMLEGVATPEVFAALIKSPEDRSDNARGLMEKVGCKLIEYYIGVNNYKSYIVIECGDGADIAALQFLTYSAGGIKDGTASQIVTSVEAEKVAEIAARLSGSYKLPD